MSTGTIRRSVRFIADELEVQGFNAGENRVARLCSSQRIWSVFAKKRGLTRKAGSPVHDDHVRRDFTATAADQLSLTDITEHRTDECKLHLCAIKDVYSNRIVGYSIDSRMKASLAFSVPAQRDSASGPGRNPWSIASAGPNSRSNAFVRT
ncbi:hypothetical protein J7E83_09880 [Arthrobacter sp. ISL-48]|nr:hypothetical protein [Arthrobacter sp. ISL-48]